MKNYMRILREIYPVVNIEGVIAYVDRREVKKNKVTTLLIPPGQSLIDEIVLCIEDRL
jgi:hypothetical protein